MLRNRVSTFAAFALLAATPLFGQDPGQDPGLEGDDVFIKSRPFSIPNKQSARALYDAARQHVEAGRWTEAVTTIERLIEEHSGSVIELGADSPVLARSIQPVYRGAADAARELFARLPAQARAAYSDRYAARAEELLARASAALDTTALADVARRYPLTAAARSAWLTLGDLEAEAGNIEAARAAWKRAAQALPDEAAPSGIGLRDRWSPGGGAMPAAFLSLASAGSDSVEIPAQEAHGWEKPLRIDENQTSPFRQDSFNSFPILAGDSVLASNSLTLSCVDALSGVLRWRSTEPPGWSEVRQGRFRARDGNLVSFAGFFNGLDREGLMLAPAAGSGVAVSALQVPFTRDANNDFNNNIHITTVIPDRRLYAFDLETGKPLWDHCPPPTWDCESGDFTQRMRVAGPPVIAGRRVLVPMWRPQGRISYYVACYDLASGAYQWSTQVASGQRSLNMFGRTDREFCAPPLVVVGERVIALTQLGTIAALDLFSGEMIWQTVYDQIPVPGADGSQAVARTARWRNAAPAVERGVVVVTPIDSEYMMGIDLADGAVLWSLDAAQLGEFSSRAGAWCLLGVRDDTVYVGGRIVMALRAKEGIAKAPSRVQARSENVFGDGFPDPARIPRAVLTARHVIAPTPEGSVVLDRANLEVQEAQSSGLSSQNWGGAPKNCGWGNLAIGNGTMFALSPQLLWGVLDWRSIEARLENDFAQHPDDNGLATRFGDFLRERAAAELKSSKPQAAELHVQRAEKILQGPSNAGLSDARLALFSTLRLKAKVLVANVQASQALEPLERAAALAPDPERLSLVLAEIARRARIDDPSRFEPTLADLERRCGDLEFPVEEDQPANEARSVLRWVIEQRIADAASRGNHSKEFAALVDLLARCGDAPMSPAIAEPPGEKSETPAMRIEQRLASGARAAWQPFEEQARVAFDSARASGDP
ncbi:MAG: PQQ-binding-like beta-propeller repeat protein, partial [Planctomycetota bacterium]